MIVNLPNFYHYIVHFRFQNIFINIFGKRVIFIKFQLSFRKHSVNSQIVSQEGEHGRARIAVDSRVWRRTKGVPLDDTGTQFPLNARESVTSICVESWGPDFSSTSRRPRRMFHDARLSLREGGWPVTRGNGFSIADQPTRETLRRHPRNCEQPDLLMDDEFN